MCWCLRVYWTVLHNLFARFGDSVANAVYNNENCCCCCCCCCNCQTNKQTKRNSTILNSDQSAENGGGGLIAAQRSSANLQHDYVIVDEIDANYVEIEGRKIETEPYYRTVDRLTAEDILSGREDGACLVRPYKEADIIIKYILSIYAQQQYFHLFIRKKISGKDLYGIGQEKESEKLFQTPSDIMDFYSYNPLLCTNKNMSLSLVIKPIIA